MGRLGDVTAALPLAHELFYQNGAVTPFIVSREYAPILDACSYVHPVPVDLPYHRLNRALQHFQKQYAQIHVAQCYATDTQMPTPATASFVTDAWHRAGLLDKFGLPLVIDRRNERRELEMLDATGWDLSKPFVVIHAGGISSPYAHRHELLHALRGLTVIDITSLQCRAPQDLLAVLERASCAILADSFPLHLSYALPNLPVLALQADKPIHWYGSPPRPNWIAKYRYAQSVTKLEEIAGLVAPLLRTPHSAFRTAFSFPPGAYNASLLPHRGKCLYTWRYHPNGTWETKLSGSAGGLAKPIQLPPHAQDCSQEDARLFVHNGKPHIGYTLSRFVGRQPRCVMEYGELTVGPKAWQVKHAFRVAHGRNDWSAMEKNHVFWSQDGKLYCLYGSQPEQVVLELAGGTVLQEHRAPSPSWAFGEIRGDVIVPHDGKLLRVFHSCERFPSRKHRYHLGVSTMSATSPFNTLSFTRAPVFSGDETRPKKAHHSKPNVVFCCGATVEGNDLIITLSRNDDSVEITRLNLNRLQL